MSQVTKNRNYHGLRLYQILEISTDLERRRIKRKSHFFLNSFSVDQIDVFSELL